MISNLKRILAVGVTIIVALSAVLEQELSSASQETRALEAGVDLIANLHSDFAMFRGDLAREQGVNLIGASVVSDDYPWGQITGRLTFWWFGWAAEDRRT